MPTIMCLSGVPQLQLFSCASMYPDARQITPIPREPERRWWDVAASTNSKRKKHDHLVLLGSVSPVRERS